MYVHALSGSSPLSTIKIKGKVRGKSLTVLIDTGATHTFLDPRVATDAGFELQEATVMEVAVANGSKMFSHQLCVEFTWEMQGTKFTYNPRILKLGGCDMVLGGDWLREYSLVVFDFKQLKISFAKEGNQVEISGFKKESSLKSMSGLKLEKLLKKKVPLLITQFAQLFSLCGIMERSPEMIKLLLEEFSDIFEEPTGLPPSKGHEHRILLKPDALPVCSRPYKYPFSQKNEIEKQVEEMLKVGTIRASHSPFASPTLLVKKKDETWRFCVDYRRLNELTEKDKFPIPNIEELLDELQGVAMFSKLDLRAGYHQVHVAEEDITKTAFRTHQV